MDFELNEDQQAITEAIDRLLAQHAGAARAIELNREGRYDENLHEALAEVEDATGGAALFYMVNCAHPSHFRDELQGGAGWMQRIRGIRANASRRSHAELDEATELDDGNPVELAEDYTVLRRMLPFSRP